MYRYKKAILLTLLISTLLITGCGNSNSKTDEDLNKVENPVQTSESEKQITITEQ